MNKTTADLMEWVKYYGIKNDILKVIQEKGHDDALKFVRQWFDGWGEADAIVEQLT